jgi:alkaline phosphatase D
MMKNTMFFLLFALISNNVLAQNAHLKSGPMLGYSEMKEVAIWVQTNAQAEVFLRYWPINHPDSSHFTEVFFTQKQEGFTALLVADTLEPGNTYQYEVFIDNQPVLLPYPTQFSTQLLWKWRTEPPDFGFTMGSGTYINEKRYDRPGKGYGGGYQIFNSMKEVQPDFMLWLGDNIYLREPDWNSRTGIMHRYTHTRSLPEIQEFLASTHHYAILDDHDFGPNDSDRGFWNQNETLRAFGLFWANPSYGVGELKGAITAFQWSDCDFFLLDNRTYRTPNNRITGEKTQLGEAQLQWLFDNLAASYATFKFVVLGGQFLNDSGVYESYTNYGFDKERERIIKFVYDENIQNVVFLTGDVHYSEISVLKAEGKPTIWDITSSPLNSGPNKNALKQKNTLRLPESVISQRNFCLVNVTGTQAERLLQVSFFDSDGKLLYSYNIEREN